MLIVCFYVVVLVLLSVDVEVGEGCMQVGLFLVQIEFGFDWWLQFFQGYGVVVGVDYVCVMVVQLVWFFYFVGMGNGFYFFNQIGVEMCYLCVFFVGYQFLLQMWVVGGDIGGIGVVVVLYCLDVVQCEYIVVCGDIEIGVYGDGLGDYGRCDQFI